MSLYNMIAGANPCVFFVLPVLGAGHPDNFPRFRDCFVGVEGDPKHDKHIIVFTRTGGGNREHYIDENNWIRSIPGFVGDWDDGFDSTYANWAFEIPDEWREDVAKFLGGEGKSTSDRYKALIVSTFPKIEDKLRVMFGMSETLPPSDRAPTGEQYGDLT